MRNPVQPQVATHSVRAQDVPSRAITAGIGERLRQVMGLESDLPPPLQSLLDRLRASEVSDQARCGHSHTGA